MDRAQLLNDSEEALRLAFDGRLATLWTAMPGIVTAVDLATMTLSIQPAIQGQIEDESGKIQSVNLPLLIHVPIQYPMAGGFAMTFPVAVDDEVLVIWASRCIDAWWQSGGIQRPIEARMHDISDGFAILGVCSQPNVVPGISATSAQLRLKDGTAYLELKPDGKIKMKSPEVEIEGDLKITGSVESTGALAFTGD
ncbi:hypothetical protein UFOVP558_1, partial [uncultured Caudovirales phage]